MAVYVPSTIGEVRDLVGAMVLCMPDMKLPNTDLGMDGAYERLEHSLGIVRETLGEHRHRQLVDMARESKQRLVGGQLKEGLFLLQDMRKLLGRRG
jgi:hypothetical protein